MKAHNTTFTVTGIAPGRSALSGRQVNLGTFRGQEDAEMCKAFFSLHYDDITIHVSEPER